MSSIDSEMSSLNSDIIAEILSRVDGTTLASTACSCSDLRSIALEEWLWEKECNSLWPSTQNQEVKQLISSFGGFRKFYGDCFPLLNVCKYPVINSKENYEKKINVAEYNGEESYDDADFVSVSVSPSDLVSLVDIHYINKSIYSKVIAADGMSHFHCRSCCVFPLYPFLIDLLCNCDGTMPSISINDIVWERDDDSSKMVLLNMMRLSWILINTRTKRAVNLSSWGPLEARKTYWGRENDFTIRFGSILPSHNTFPLELVACNIMVRCRVGIQNEEGINLQINEISVRLEDVMGNEVNGREGGLAIERAMKWVRRSKDHHHIIQACRQALEIQSEYMMEEKVQAFPSRTAPLYLLFPFVALALSYYHFFM